jgi:hypothetical protein
MIYYDIYIYDILYQPRPGGVSPREDGLGSIWAAIFTEMGHVGCLSTHVQCHGVSSKGSKVSILPLRRTHGGQQWLQACLRDQALYKPTLATAKQVHSKFLTLRKISK